MNRPVVIIHFQPLELYPPVMNLLNYIHANHPECSVIVLTTKHGSISTGIFAILSKKISIHRFGKTGAALPAFRRYLNYFYFYAASFFTLLIKKPSAILYYETLSSYPAYLYKKYVSQKIPVFIHYHEYTSPAEYISGMKLVAYFHKREKKIYNKAAWISHTNEDRLSLFLSDENLPHAENMHVLPNYPAKQWQHTPHPATGIYKIVYAGALSMDTMYTEAFAKWVHQQNGRFLWDIYSNNITSDARAFFKSLNSTSIRLLKGVEYTALQNILPQYHIGIILYNGHIPNYVFNAPNKLFEYLVCGLDVWYPDIMKGCLPYTTTDTYPAVIGLDFLNLPESFAATGPGTAPYTYKPSVYFYENIYPELVNKLTESKPF